MTGLWSEDYKSGLRNDGGQGMTGRGSEDDKSEPGGD